MAEEELCRDLAVGGALADGHGDAQLRRPQASWPMLVVVITRFIALRALDVIAPGAVFSAVALVVLVWSAVELVFGL